MTEYFEIGQIVNTFGIKGMVKIKPFTDDINKFIKSFEMTQKMMKKMKSNKGGMKKLMNGIDENALKNFKF